MTIDFQQLLAKYATPTNLLAAKFGLEREGQRVTCTGQLAITDFPVIFKGGQSRIQRDFAETQLELVTPIATSSTAVVAALTQLQTTVQHELAPAELIWPLSMPPVLPAATDQIRIAKLADPAAVAYREYIAKVYGRRRQMLSGVHLNLELAPALMQTMFQHQTTVSTFQEFKAVAYFKLTQNYLHYRWLTTYLFGVTPVSEANFFTTLDQPSQPVRSIRNSRYGYTNASTLHVSYASLATYLSDLQTAVARGQLSAMKEFYGQVRLRGGHQMTDLATTGVQYLELRHLDLNPFATVGITVDQIQFLQGFLLFMLTLPTPQTIDRWVAQGTARNQAMALSAPWELPARLTEGQQLLAAFEQFCEQYQLKPLQPLIKKAQFALTHPEKTLAAKWWQLIKTTPQSVVATQLAQHYQQQVSRQKLRN